MGNGNAKHGRRSAPDRVPVRGLRGPAPVVYGGSMMWSARLLGERLRNVGLTTRPVSACRVLSLRVRSVRAGRVAPLIPCRRSDRTDLGRPGVVE